MPVLCVSMINIHAAGGAVVGGGVSQTSRLFWVVLSSVSAGGVSSRRGENDLIDLPAQRR